MAQAAGLVLQGMAGMNGILLSEGFEPMLSPLLRDMGVVFGPVPHFFGAPEALGIAILFAVALFAPNSHQLLGYMQPPATDPSRPTRAVERGDAVAVPLRWVPNPGWAVVVGLSFVFILMQLSNISEFLYFQF